MRHARFGIMTDILFKKCNDTLNAKNEEYARGDDKLHNFKKAAAFINKLPTTALMGMMLKHTTSIYDMLDDLEAGKRPSMTLWDEKIGDQINYLICMRGLIDDMYMEEHIIQLEEDCAGEIGPIDSE
jgi:hypothetical protein